jgi:hypothetical protein
MKKSIVAVAIAIIGIMGVSSVSAQMVDIGTGQMEPSEFMALKAMVQGQPVVSGPQISTPLASLERYGMVEIPSADIEAIRNKMTGRNDDTVVAKPIAKPVQMVTIGTGEMPVDEFIALKKMVEKSEICNLDHLAARLALAAQ